MPSVTLNSTNHFDFGSLSDSDDFKHFKILVSVMVTKIVLLCPLIKECTGRDQVFSVSTTSLMISPNIFISLQFQEGLSGAELSLGCGRPRTYQPVRGLEGEGGW